MKRIAVGLVALMLLLNGAEAAVHLKPIANPPTQAQLDAFYAACVKWGPADLCKCKETAAPKLVDTSFMDVIIASMKGKSLDPKYNIAYNDYIANSNTICKPDYM
jgi:hypothetical protein